MYLKKTQTPKGRIHLSIVDGYYDKETKNSCQITIESLGYLDDLEKFYDNPIAHFTKRVEQLKKEKKLDKLSLTSPFFDLDKFCTGDDFRKNVGLFKASCSGLQKIFL